MYTPLYLPVPVAIIATVANRNESQVKAKDKNTFTK